MKKKSDKKKKKSESSILTKLKSGFVKKKNTMLTSFDRYLVQTSLDKQDTQKHVRNLEDSISKVKKLIQNLNTKIFN